MVEGKERGGQREEGGGEESGSRAPPFKGGGIAVILPNLSTGKLILPGDGAGQHNAWMLTLAGFLETVGLDFARLGIEVRVSC